MKKIDIRLIGMVVFSLLFVIVSIAMSRFTSNQANRLTTSSQASSSIPAECKCTDPTMCSPDGCSRVPKSPSNTFDEGRYDNVCNQFDPGYRMPDSIIQYYCSVQQPSCCEDIYRYKDDRLCCFQERWSCHPSFCEGVTQGNGDCGKYWHIERQDWNTYGCVQRGANGQIEGMWGLPPGLPGGSQPTNTPAPQPTAPQPTNTRPPQQPTTANQQPTATIQPTRYNPAPTSASQPTTFIQPTTDYQLPTTYVTQTTALPTPVPIEFKSPKELAQEVINPESVTKLSTATEKPLNAPKKIFTTIENIDSSIEAQVDKWTFETRIFFLNLFQ
ncbi:hypothetical protein KBD81_04845 [Candidatus Woesebacteria bacterium]|nr:hypothetical protein [Candidatus Woesebacteria bacterium]